MLQLNANHTRAAQDLLVQHMIEAGAAMACIAEPYSVPDSRLWFGDLDGVAAIHWNPLVCRMEARPIERGPGFVAIRIDKLRVYSTYLPSNEPRINFEDRLDRLADSIRRTGPSPLIVMGDFNAALVSWGSGRPNLRGEIVEEWSASLDLVLLNVGTTPTCSRFQGVSIVDLTWCSVDITDRIVNWRVMADVESLSDHFTIVVILALSTFARNGGNGYRSRVGFSRWSHKSMDWDLLRAAITLKDWLCPQPIQCEPEEAASRLGELLVQA